MDFAPVSDVNSNPANPIIGVRSFSDDPELVAEHVTAFIKGMDSAKISTALKHFPGHGNVGEDSHTHLPCSDFSLEEIKACDLIPFQAGIDAGSDMIMTAHIQFPKIEKKIYVSIKDGEEITLPATLSRTIITGLLREQMGYNGIVITDAMKMDAIAAHFDPLDAAVMAINADVDILLCPVELYKDGEVNTFPDVDKYMEGLLARVEAGDIREEELDNSVLRILKLKKERDLLAPTEQQTAKAPLEQQIAQAAEAVGTSANHKREWEIAQAALLCLNLPYDAACYEEVDAVLCAYQPYGSAHDEEGNGPFNLNVAVAICTAFNQSVPSGVLPVNVPKVEVKDGEVYFLDEYLYERGYGLKE